VAEGIEFKLWHDKECPFCRREVEWLARRDERGRLAVEDIAVPGFDPSRYGLTRADVVAQLHGVLPDGSVTSNPRSTAGDRASRP
jgi:predicted DCC family thiol-disulfide oxidoreductase YuxK